METPTPYTQIRRDDARMSVVVDRKKSPRASKGDPASVAAAEIQTSPAQGREIRRILTKGNRDIARGVGYDLEVVLADARRVLRRR